MILSLADQKMVQSFYFFLLRNGFLSKLPPTQDTYMPGTKSYTVQSSTMLKGIDWWFSHSSLSKTVGGIVIYYYSIPVWQMSLTGHYEPEDIPLLKEALALNAESHHFLGGRGPRVYRSGRMRYTNSPQGDFRHFKGFEKIMVDNSVVGSHTYTGGFLVDWSTM